MRVNVLSTHLAPSKSPEIHSLIELSVRLGRDPLLVQASTGNTSLKIDGTLWIKASGKWLAGAAQEEMFVPVNLAACLNAFEHGEPLPPYEGLSQRLQPSIETFMHAVLPHRAVIHVHSVNTIAWAVRRDAPLQLSERLAGLRWQWIPYVPSGRALAQDIEIAALPCPDADVFILGNHGLVVCGEDCATAEALLLEVERRLALEPLLGPKPKIRFLQQVQRLSEWRLPETEALHTLATDSVCRRIAKGGVLFPCQAVFLGRNLPIVPCSQPISDVRSRMNPAREAVPFLIVEGCGVLIRHDISAAEYAILNGFAEVVRRIDQTTFIRYLSDLETRDAVRGGASYKTCFVSRSA